MEEKKSLPVLNAEEARVLGVLMEKSRTTPEYYPMTINAITTACNQKTSRKPVVTYDEQTVTLTIDALKRRGLISTAMGGSSRTIKYKHNFSILYPVLPAEVAVLCLLLLRGAQTPGEINTNSGRLYEFDSLEEVQSVLEKLSHPDFPYVVQLPKRSGQKELRYIHLLCGTPDLNDEAVDDEPNQIRSVSMESRVSKLEEELSAMRADLDKLMKELLG